MKTRSCLVFCLLSAHAAADPCVAGRVPEPGTPARVATGPAGIGSLPESCGATDIALRGDAAVLIATDDYYGSLTARAALRARYALDGSLWFSAWIPGADYRYVANATVDQDSTDLGAGALGVHFGLPVGARARFAPFVRVLLPTETVYLSATRYAIDHGFSAAWRATADVELLGGAVFPAFFTDAFGTVHTSFEPSLDLEASFSAWRSASVVIGAEAKIRGGEPSGFESFTPRAALRWLAFRRLRTELATGFPLFGDDRTDFALALEVGWILDRP